MASSSLRLFERVHDGDGVDRVADVLELEDGTVDALVRVEQEVFGPELFGGVDDGDSVEQHRAKDRDLGLHGCRQTVVQGHGNGLCGHVRAPEEMMPV